MKTYNKSEIMSRAWKFLKREPFLSFGDCLFLSWQQAKKERENYVSPAIMLKIINNLKTFNRSRSTTENKPMLAGTQEHFKILNSRIGRKIMKLPAEDDSRQMLQEGELFLQDILHQRRKESKNFIAPNKKVKTKFRNRIINSENCVKINIEEYV